MLADPSEYIAGAIAILGRTGAMEDQIDQEMIDLTGDRGLAERLIDWIPEVFGFVLASHLAEVHLPKTFSARSAKGNWVEIDIDREPIVRCAARDATEIFHSDSRPTLFRAVVERSAVYVTINDMMNAGESLEGATLAGPALIGIPAEIYG